MGGQTQGLACGGGPSGKRLGSGWGGGWPPESTPLWGREGAGLVDSGRRSLPVLLPPPCGLRRTFLLWASVSPVVFTASCPATP